MKRAKTAKKVKKARKTRRQKGGFFMSKIELNKLGKAVQEPLKKVFTDLIKFVEKDRKK
jgi:hypothetical protein